MERQEGHTRGPLSIDRRVLTRLVVSERVGFSGDYRVADAYHSSTGLANTPRFAEAKANAARLAAAWNCLAGIPTTALEQLASLPAKERFGALSDIAKLHEMKEG